MTQAQRAPRQRFKPFGPQREFWTCTDREVLLSSGWGGGKTRSLLEKLDYYTKRYPGAKCLIARKVNADLPGSTLDEYLTKVLPEDHIHRGPNKTEQWVEVITQPGQPPSKVTWGGLDRRRKFGSTEFGFIAVDEANELEYQDWIWLRGRLRQEGVGYHQIAGATNPPDEGKEHWMHDYFIQDPTRRVIYCPPTDNPHLDPAYLEDLNSLEGILHERFVQGKWVGAQGTWLKRDMLQTVRAEDIKDRPLRWIVSLDLGVEPDPKKAEENDTDYWAAVIGAYDAQHQQGYLVDVARQRGMDKTTAADWLTHIMSTVPTNTARIEANQAQVFFVQEARERGITVDPVNQTGDKTQRLLYLSIPFSRGKVKLVNHDPDTPEDGFDDRWDPFLHEWTTFPGRHDDVLDATEMTIRPMNLGLNIAAYSGHAYGDR